jgi:hypothetical protein
MIPVFWDVALCTLYKFTDVSEVLAVSITRAMSDLMMDTESSSEKSVNFYQTTRRYIPEDSHLHTLKSF